MLGVSKLQNYKMDSFGHTCCTSYSVLENLRKVFRKINPFLGLQSHCGDKILGIRLRFRFLSSAVLLIQQ